MQSDDFLANKQQHRNGYRNNEYRDSFRYSQNVHRSHQRSGNNYKWLYFLDQLKNNRKLKRLIVFALFLIFAILIALLLIFLPLLSKFLNYIHHHGVQGMLDYIVEFLNKIWSGLPQ